MRTRTSIPTSSGLLTSRSSLRVLSCSKRQQLQSGSPTNQGRCIRACLHAGLNHYAYNDACEKATILATFTNIDPGTVLLVPVCPSPVLNLPLPLHLHPLLCCTSLGCAIMLPLHWDIIIRGVGSHNLSSVMVSWAVCTDGSGSARPCSPGSFGCE